MTDDMFAPIDACVKDLISLGELLDFAGAGTNRLPQFVFLTSGAYPDEAGQALKSILTQMPLASLVRGLATETPEYQVRVIDADDAVLAAPRLLADHILTPTDETESILRDGKCFAPRLKRVSDDDFAPKLLTVNKSDTTTNFHATMRVPGVIDNVELSEIPLEPVGVGEVRVRIATVGLNFCDIMAVTGLLRNEADVDRTQMLLTATVPAPHSEVTRSLAAQAETSLAENEPSIATRAVGLAIAFARISERNNSQMLYGFLTALSLISLTLVITLRSVRFGLISRVPYLAPALSAFGLWGLTIGDVSLGSTVVTTMTFGIVVDDTVHFLMHFLRSRRRGLDTQTALENTFAVVGSSITLTSTAMVLGFSIMAASGLSINQHIGMLTAVVIVFALLCDLVLLPAIIKLTQEKPR